ncbi:chorismate synthase [Flavobacteriales bacterium]|nr:chorismate synthase [Flavobacteriales bacterium]
MAGNTFGTIFRLTTFGESHGAAIGGVIDGCPSGLKVDFDAIQADLNRRKPGQSKLTTSRKEQDRVEWLSGIFEGQTTGTPIGFLIRNSDQNPTDYDHIKSAFRPSHADFTYNAKYGIRDHRGGGRSSARETACRVVAGGIARLILAKQGIQACAYVDRVQNVAFEAQPHFFERTRIDATEVRCPDVSVARAMEKCIDEAKADGDTVGGSISAVVTGVPAGWGEPVFDKLQAVLAHAMWSLPAVKAMEIGSGIAGSKMRGSEHNDIWVQKAGEEARTETNHSGGIQGGISNGQDIVMRVTFKPVSTIMQAQPSIDRDGNAIKIEGKGRHDPCVLPRAVPLVEAMAMLVLVDEWLKNRTTRLD